MKKRSPLNLLGYGAASLAIIVLVIGIYAGRHQRNFNDIAQYWRENAEVGSTLGADIARLTLPFMNQGGIEFLLAKLDKGDDLDQETATLALLSIYEPLSGVSNLPEKEQGWLDAIKRSSLIDKARRFAQDGSNSNTEFMLAKFIERYDGVKE